MLRCDEHWKLLPHTPHQNAPPPLVTLLVQLELVQAGECLATQRADVAPRRCPPARPHGGSVVVRGGGGVVEAVQCERRPVGGGCGGGVPLRVFMKRVDLGVSGRVRGVLVLSVLLRTVCDGGRSGGLEGRPLCRDVLLVLIAVGGLTGQLGGGLGGAAGLASGRRETSCVSGWLGNVLEYSSTTLEKSKKPGVNVVPFDDGRPELVLSIGPMRSHREVGFCLPVPCWHLSRLDAE